MKIQLFAGVLLLVIGGALFWNDLQERRAQPLQVSGRASAAPATNSPSTQLSQSAVSAEITTTEETPAVAPEPSVVAESTRPAELPAEAPAIQIASAEVVPGPELAPGLTPKIVLENVRSVFRNYSSRFGGNPVGSNLEITRALNGANAGQAVFLNPDDGLRVNERGELIDNWGTPFFFHQLSARQMEIRSAGADRRLWTADDLVIR